jgi:hypothetical protein
MLIALMVNEENLPVITVLNDDVAPEQKYMDTPTYFISRDDPSTKPNYVEAEFFETFYEKKSHHVPDIYVVEEK